MFYNQIDNTNVLYILKLLNRQTDIAVVLQSISHWLENLIPDAIVSVMLVSEDKQHLNLISANNYFSDNYKNAIKNLKIGANIGSCGAAAYYKKMIICENLDKHPNWVDFREYIQHEKISACWSIPIINTEDKLYGTFGTYYKKPKSPTEAEIKILYEVALLTALCLDFYYEREHKNAVYEKYHSFYDNHPAAVYEHDLNGIMNHVNMTSKKINGFEVAQVIGTYYLDYIPQDYQATVEHAFIRARQGDIQQLEVPIYDVEHQIYWADLTYMPIFKNNEVIGILGIVKNITQRYQLEQNLNLLKRGIEASPNGLTIITKENLNYKIVYANSAFFNMTGFSKEEVFGQNCYFLQGKETETEAVKEIINAIQNNQSINITLKNYKKDGTWFWNELTVSPVFDKNKNCTHFICTQQDVTKKRLDQEYISYQQTHDNLTNLINRQIFERLLGKAFPEKNHPLIILYIDLDDFRTINKDLGYAKGDELIKSVAQRLRMILNDQDVLSRFSADSFALLIHRSITEKQIVVIAEEILKNLSLPFHIEEEYIHLTASIGIADVTPLTKSPRELLYNAIQSMYDAKNDQSHTWKWYVDDQVNSQKLSEVKIRHDLSLALKEQQFKLHYQPILDSETKSIVGVEALIRWYHPERGLISPACFIPLAERSGQIFPIGNWIIEQACKDIAQINKNRIVPLQLSINISPVQFKDTYFLNQISKSLSLYKFNAELLKIEITEGVFMMGGERTIEILNTLQDLGIKISIDDFGTEYSSLSYLRRFPIDQIKLDRSFIEFLPEQEKDSAIVMAIIEMAKKLQLEIVVEGVETAAQVNFLTENKNHLLLQGFYFSQAIPVEDLDKLLAKNDALFG